jgi:thiamine biosynthesis lipoprotein
MSSVTMRRARPWLGTVVDVSVRAPDVKAAGLALAGAFAVIERVHRLMSPSEPASDVAAINRALAGTTVAVARETFAVLAFCARLNRASQGVFDPCCTAAIDGAGRFTDLALDPDGSRVRVQQPVRLDLGGVAKGYAVDEAVRVARTAGADGGLINAGGDMRAWGDAPIAVHVRHPIENSVIAVGSLGNAALATSAIGSSQYVNPLKAGMALPFISASVTTPDCMAADALTKVVLTSPAPPLPLLAEFSAAALVIDPAGRIFSTRAPLLPEMLIAKRAHAPRRDESETIHV